jgi:hypothetical protein
MKVQYKLKQTSLVLIDYTADLTLENLTPEQLDFIRVLLLDATKYNTLFAKSERDELSGQKLIDQIAVQLKD